MNCLDRADRVNEIRALILRKPSLRKLYRKYYQYYAECLARCPEEGTVVEIGSGAGFSKESVPEIVATDILPYSTIDLCVDAMQMPFRDRSLRAIFMLNTLHHIPDAERFFNEARRCLKPNGRILIIDQYPGWMSYWVLKYAHHEPFDDTASAWAFDTSGPLSGANGALAWMVFYRDRKRFEELFPELAVTKRTRHSPLCYWLTGGLKSWNLLPGPLFSAASKCDDVLSRVLPPISSFVSIELVRL